MGETMAKARIRATPFLALCLKLAAGQVLAADIYVDVNAAPGGDGSQAHPYQSIQTAVDRSPAGSNLIVKPGTYFQALALTKSITMTPQNAVKITPFEPLECEMDASAPVCPRVVIGESGATEPLEPSGLVWSAAAGHWIGVSDNFNDLQPAGYGRYAVFGFRVAPVVTGNIPAFPLLTAAQVSTWHFNDLEGITRLANGRFAVIGSLSLHSKKPARDTWYRFQGFEFGLSADVASNLKRLSDNYRADLREWIISSAGLPWQMENITGRPETQNGLNVEGLASIAASGGSDLLIGFRGPLFGNESAETALILRTNALPPDQLPAAVGTYYPSMPATDGIRGIERIPLSDADIFVMLAGPTGTAHDPLGLHVWDLNYNDRQLISQLPDGFVAEGVDVQTISTHGNDHALKIGIIDDLNAKFMMIETSITASR